MQTLSRNPAWTNPILIAFVTAFSTPPAAETWAPTFQGLLTRSRNSDESNSFAFAFPLPLACLVRFVEFGTSGSSTVEPRVSVVKQKDNFAQSRFTWYNQRTGFCRG